VKIKNYTSGAPKSQTIWRIQQILIAAKVASISMDYQPNGEVAAVTFHIQTDLALRPVPVRLPAELDACHSALWRDYVAGDRTRSLPNGDEDIVWGNKRKKKSDFLDQAERTAWKIVQDWLEVQLSMIHLKQADFVQVFLPYVWDGKQTFYARIKEGGLAMLEAPKPTPTETPKNVTPTHDA
jgi:hypothetical protein